MCHFPNSDSTLQEIQHTGGTAPGPTMSGLWRRRLGGRMQLSLSTTISSAKQDTGTMLSLRQKFLETEYALQERLGSGSSGSVFRAIQTRDGETVALKMTRSSDPEMLRTAREEYDLLRELSHPHIIKTYGFHSFGVRDMMVLEFFEGKTLHHHVAGEGALVEADACRLGMYLFSALAYLHDQDVLHRDPHPGNILISHDSRDLRLIDFNTAKRLSSFITECTDIDTYDSSPTASASASGSFSYSPMTPFADPVPTTPLTPRGASEYVAPEVIGGDIQTKASDVWMGGLCLHLMLTARLPQRRGPCHESTRFARLQRIAQRPFRRDALEVSSLSEGAKDTLEMSLNLDPETRTSASALLQTRWFQSDKLAGVEAYPEVRGDSV